MKSGGRSGHRSALSRVNSLISFAIAGGVFASNVRRQRSVPDLFQALEEIVRRREPNPPLAKLAALDHFGSKFIVLPEEQPFSHTNFPPRSHQAFPFIRLPLQLPRQQNFNASTQKISRRWIPHAHRLRP